MWIEQLTIKNCRSLKDINLTFSPHLNLIIGENASGKTSLLEALTLLSNGKSFRTSHISELISHDESSVLVSSRINTKDGQSHIGFDKSSKKTKIRINKQDIYSQAELSLYLPITAIHPGSIELITGSPSLRRAYIDWVVFYLFPDFLDKWKEYRHILKQRNICLKQPKHRYALAKWTNELVTLQPVINNYRVKALKLIQPVLSSVSKNLLGEDEVSLTLTTGFPKDQSLDHDELLDFYIEKEFSDIKSQRTLSGIHAADIKIKIGSKPAKECASRGQLKLLVISLLLTQSAVINTSHEKGLLIIDDLAAELDQHNKEKLLKYLSTLNQQLVITSTNHINLGEIPHKVFHVKHGILSR